MPLRSTFGGGLARGRLQGELGPLFDGAPPPAPVWMGPSVAPIGNSSTLSLR